MKTFGSDTLYQVAIYIRLSREDGDKDESNSITHQREILQKYVEEHANMIVYDEYVDDGYTGTNFERPGFSRMLDDIHDNKINCVLVKDLSRFARNYIMAGMYIEKYFPEWGVRFIALGENYDSETADTGGQDILLPIQNLFNEFHARDTSRKVQRVMHQMQRDGKYVAAFAPYGYKKDPLNKHHLVVDDYAAEIVKKIFNLYLEGRGAQTIAKALNREDVLCPTLYKQANGSNFVNHNRLVATTYWTESTVRTILLSEVYIGTLVQGKSIRSVGKGIKPMPREEWIRVPNTHEAIIDTDTFRRVQDLYKRNTKHMTLDVPTSLFAGFIKCGDCGRSLVKTEWNGKITYKCGTYKRLGTTLCTSHSIKESVLIDIVLQDLNAIVGEVKNLADMVEHSRPKIAEKKLRTRKLQLQSELDKCIRKKRESYDDYKEGLLTKEEYLGYGIRCDNQKKQFELELESIENQEKQKDNFLHNPWVEKLLSTGTIKQLDKSILADMVETIFIYENQQVRIVYKFSDELDYLFEKTVTINI